MDKTSASPWFPILYFMIRCLLPMLILLGVSYLFRRFGLIKDTPIPPDHREDSETKPPEDDASKHGNGGFVHGSV